ncbi:DsrH/TusB family sulfur metabolism protein [Glaciecola siphonariae]|uniref:DsrH/TusB family sulfur metabolism protein n=1 Tax=Glaciecola siphonariae TaxID=521012 RepID=A0ABV9LUM8_9ALTE
MLLQVFCNQFELLQPYVETHLQVYEDAKVQTNTAKTLSIVLLQDAVYLLPKTIAYISSLSHVNDADNLSIYVLEPDYLASGLAGQPSYVSCLGERENVEVINHTQWVDLCVKHQPIVSIQV